MWLRALQLDPNNFKAVFRRGIAYMAMDTLAAAQDDLIEGFFHL